MMYAAMSVEAECAHLNSAVPLSGFTDTEIRAGGRGTMQLVCENNIPVLSKQTARTILNLKYFIQNRL
jgi:hypothetical protein